MKLVTVTPKRIRGERSAQEVAYICDPCAADHGVRIPPTVENMQVLTVLCSGNEDGSEAVRKCSHPLHANPPGNTLNAIKESEHV